MTLPIADSMIRGELRTHILTEVKDNQTISRLWGVLHKWEKDGDASLRGIEKALTDAVGTSELVKVEEIYRSERNLREGALMLRKSGLSADNPDFTRVGAPFCLDGIFTPILPLSPTDRFRHLLLDLECRRTMMALRELVLAMHDDGIIRTEIIRLFVTIKQLCDETDEDFIRNRLTQFYFELYHSFQNILKKGERQNYETDFQNFVFGWLGRFPDDETVERYEKMIAAYRPIVKPEQKAAPISSESELPTHNEPPVAKDKFQKFLEAAEDYHFSQLPKVQDLESPEKTMKLVKCMLQDKGTAEDNYAHAAAMLEYLGFRKWYSDNYGNWTTTEYDKWCSKYVMGMATGQAFKHYRQSVYVNPNDKEKDAYRLMGWKYKNTVEQEYGDILKGYEVTSR